MRMFEYHQSFRDLIVRDPVVSLVEALLGDDCHILAQCGRNRNVSRRTDHGLLMGTDCRERFLRIREHGGAVRIGDGAMVTGPGEIFSEIGLAVKERWPAEVTLYAGYTNGAISYFPTAAEYPLGGYEPNYGNKPYGLPAQVRPESERILIETGVRLVRSLFPEREAPEVEGWTASGQLPVPPVPVRLERPGSDS